VSLTARILGVALPVVVATSLCLTVPFIILVADAAILGAAVFVFASERAASHRVVEASRPELE
jgi:hypothetical protein